MNQGGVRLFSLGRFFRGNRLAHFAQPAEPKNIFCNRYPGDCNPRCNPAPVRQFSHENGETASSCPSAAKTANYFL